MLNYGEWLRSERKKRKLTQGELAARAGICVYTLQCYEYGTREPKLSNMRKINEALFGKEE